ncbi:MAG TPA: glycosyltransferase family 39 protein [Pyrinomonadaceae bacterium]
MQPSTLAKRVWPLFLLAALAFYLYGLGALPFVGPDEPRYAQVAREMYARGDMVTPTLGGHTWFEKPALLYWMLMASFKAFGVSEWAARLGPACAGLLTIILVYWLGRRVERAIEHEEAKAQAEESTPRADDSTTRAVESKAGIDEAPLAPAAPALGLWSAVALASCAGLIIFSRAVSFDVIVTMTMTAALACFFVSGLERVERRRRWLLACFYACVGASLLAKGLIGVVIPAGIVGLDLLWQRRWPERRLLTSLLWGVPLALIVAALWYAPVIERHGSKFIDEFIIQHHFARFATNKYHHPGPFYYYLPAILILSLPWPVLLIDALARARRWNWRGTDALSRFRLFALMWMVVPIAFFSLSGSKLPGYILPSLPAAALLIGERLARVAQGEGRANALRATGLLLLVLVGGGMLFARSSGYITTASAALILAPLFIAGLFALLAARLRRLSVLFIAGATLLSIALAVNALAGAIGRRESTRELLRQASARGFDATPVCGLYVIERTAEFYAAGRIMRDSSGEVLRFEGAAQALEAARQSGGTILVFVPIEGINQLTDYKALQTEIIGDNGAVALIIAHVKE